MLFSSRIRVKVSVRIRFGVWLVSGYAHAYVIVTPCLFTYQNSAKVGRIFGLFAPLCRERGGRDLNPLPVAPLYQREGGERRLDAAEPVRVHWEQRNGIVAPVVSVVAIALLHGQHVVSFRRTVLQHELHFVEVLVRSAAVSARRHVRHVRRFCTQQPVEDHR